MNDSSLPTVLRDLEERETKRLVEAHDATLSFLFARTQWRRALGEAVDAGLTIPQLTVVTGLHGPGIRHVLRTPTPEFIGLNPTDLVSRASRDWRIVQDRWEATRSARILRATLGQWP